MIRLLAQIISRQLSTPKAESVEKITPPAVVGPTSRPTFSSSCAAIGTTAAKPAGPPSSATSWSQPSRQDMVSLFSELAQRHLHSVQAQTGGDR